MGIKDVDFGRLDAESDDKLASYFLDTGVLSKLKSGARQFVLGRKGSGKTALLKLATSEALGQAVVPLEFADYPWEAHKAIKESGMAAEQAYVASWRFLCLVAFVRHWAHAADGELRRKAASLIAQVYPDEDPGPFGALIDRIEDRRRGRR
jgi:hypothetical protein